MNKWSFRTGGIPDEMFLRDRVPMTKAEVRAVTLAKARLADNHIIWDIGAGTGSISVEAALTSALGRVFAIEKEDDAVELIGNNAALFGTSNLSVIHGGAPEALLGLPDPDRVIIGGSGGNLKDIIELVFDRLPEGGRLVVNAVVLETLTTAVEVMKACGFRGLDIVQIAVSKTVEIGRVNMFKSHNPVFIISGEK